VPEVSKLLMRAKTLLQDKYMEPEDFQAANSLAVSRTPPPTATSTLHSPRHIRRCSVLTSFVFARLVLRDEIAGICRHCVGRRGGRG